MTSMSLTEKVVKGLDALEQENTLVALMHFEEASSQCPSPVVLSGLGYCIARERGEIARAVSLCRQAIAQEPTNPRHHYYLGRIYLQAGRKHLALTSFRKGVKLGGSPGIMTEIRRLGLRQRPVFPYLGRKHPVNKVCGILLCRLGLR